MYRVSFNLVHLVGLRVVGSVVVEGVKILQGFPARIRERTHRALSQTVLIGLCQEGGCIAASASVLSGFGYLCDYSFDLVGV
jgi:hypothetical protein